MTAAIDCPSCGQAMTVAVTVAPLRWTRAAKRAPTPEFLHVCPHCHALTVLAFGPARCQAGAHDG